MNALVVIAVGVVGALAILFTVCLVVGGIFALALRIGDR